jgi:hypothetical protein
MAWVMWLISAEAVNVLAEATTTHFGWANEPWGTVFATTRTTVAAEDKLAKQLVADELQSRARRLPDHG